MHPTSGEVSDCSFVGKVDLHQRVLVPLVAMTRAIVENLIVTHKPTATCQISQSAWPS